MRKSRNHKKGGVAYAKPGFFVEEIVEVAKTGTTVAKQAAEAVSKQGTKVVAKSSFFKVIKDIFLGLPWFVIGIILAIVGGLIFVAFGWVMAIGSIIYFSGAIVAIYKSKDTKTDWLWAGAQSWFFVIRH